MWESKYPISLQFQSNISLKNFSNTSLKNCKTCLLRKNYAISKKAFRRNEANWTYPHTWPFAMTYVYCRRMAFRDIHILWRPHNLQSWCQTYLYKVGNIMGPVDTCLFSSESIDIHLVNSWFYEELMREMLTTKRVYQWIHLLHTHGQHRRHKASAERNSLILWNNWIIFICGTFQKDIFTLNQWAF